MEQVKKFFLVGCLFMAAFLYSQEIFQDEGGGVDNNYILRPFDMIRFTMFQEPDMTQEVRLDADGTVLLPLIGKQKIGGMTVEGSQRFLAELYNKDYFVNPQINILVVEVSPRRVQVLGQVNNQGPIEIPIDRNLNLVDAISGAGGPTRLANTRKVTVKREVENGRTLTFELDMQQMMTDADAEPFILEDGDTIFIPERTF